MNDGRDDSVESSAETEPRSDAEREFSGSSSQGPEIEAADSSTEGGVTESSETGEANDFVTAEERPEDVPKEILEYTTDRRSIEPLVQVQWGVRTGIGAILLGLVATAVVANFGVDTRLGSLLVGLFLVLGTVWVVLRYRVWVYQVRADALYLERGVVRHVRTLVPYVRIQHVDTSRGPLERVLGLSTLVVYTAGSRGADVSVPGLTPKEARDLQQRVKELAIEAEGGDAL